LTRPPRTITRPQAATTHHHALLSSKRLYSALRSACLPALAMAWFSRSISRR
jgi:hypothetical protein